MEKISIFEEISKEAYDSSAWIYVKLQSHMEKLLKNILINVGRHPYATMKGNIDEISKIYPRINFERFVALNRKANNVKHANDKEELYEREFLHDFSKDFNNMVLISGLDSTAYLLDETLFEKPLSVTQGDEAKAKLCLAKLLKY